MARGAAEIDHQQKCPFTVLRITIQSVRVFTPTSVSFPWEDERSRVPAFELHISQKRSKTLFSLALKLADSLAPRRWREDPRRDPKKGPQEGTPRRDPRAGVILMIWTHPGVPGLANGNPPVLTCALFAGSGDW